MIPQQNTFLYELNTDAHMAGVAASAKLPDDGKYSFLCCSGEVLTVFIL